MAMQMQPSNFAKKMGARIVQANAMHADKPVDTGNLRLPAIDDGAAKLVSMELREYENDNNGPGTKGKPYFVAAASIVWPIEAHGQRVAGRQTYFRCDLDDMPAKGQRKASTFDENWFKFQNLFKLLGVPACRETPQTDPDSSKTWAYFMAAMKALTDPKRPSGPVLVQFSVSEWTPKPTKEEPNPEKRSTERWHGLADPSKMAPHDPAKSVNVAPSTNGANANAAPVISADGFPANPTDVLDTSDVNSGPDDYDIANDIDALVAAAMEDPQGTTPEGEAATDRLTELAVAAGWTEDQVLNAESWEQVGEMAVNAPDETKVEKTLPTIGMAAKFAKRDKQGEKLKNKKNVEFPPIDVVITSVDPATGTCTVKTAKDGKDVVDLATKKPVAVKFEWLE